MLRRSKPRTKKRRFITPTTLSEVFIVRGKNFVILTIVVIISFFAGAFLIRQSLAQYWNPGGGSEPPEGDKVKPIYTDVTNLSEKTQTIFGNSAKLRIDNIASDDTGDAELQLKTLGYSPLFLKTYGITNEGDEGKFVTQTSDGGYFTVGEIHRWNSEDNDFWLTQFNSDGTINWAKKVDVTGTDSNVESVAQTSDGGYILTGDTGLVIPNLLLIKFASDGTEDWSITYGGASNDYGKSVMQTYDGGYIVVGHTYSFSSGLSDLWLIKFDSLGNIEAGWPKKLPGGNYEYGLSVDQTDDDGDGLQDDGYIVTGARWTGSAGNADVWVIKFNSDGTINWNKIIGGGQREYGFSVEQSDDDGDGLQDDGYIVVGFTESYGAGGSDLWLIKLFSDGSIDWNKTIGGSEDDGGATVVQTSDRGYVVAGYTQSFGAAVADAWIIKLNNSGTVEWNNMTGEANWDDYGSVAQTSDGGYIAFGELEGDMLLTKLDSTGNMEDCTEFISPVVTEDDTHNPNISDVSSTPTTPSPTPGSPSITVTIVSPDPTVTTICESTGINENIHWSIYSYWQDGDLNISYGDETTRTNYLTLDKETGNLGIGDTAPDEKLTVDKGSILINQGDPEYNNHISTGSYKPQDVFVSGDYAYVVSYYESPPGTWNNRLAIYNISNPDNIVFIGSTEDNLGKPESVYVAGKYAYVANSQGTQNYRFSIFNISNPSSITAMDTTNDSIRVANDVYIAGDYAYVVCGGTTGANPYNDRLTIFDISDPNAILMLDNYLSASTVDNATSIYLSGNYAYVTAEITNNLVVFDISNQTWEYRDQSEVGDLSSPQDVYVSGSYVYVADQGNDRLVIFNISEPLSITYVNSTNGSDCVGGGALDRPVEVYVSGNYAYVVSEVSNYLTIFDISDPSAIVCQGYYMGTAGYLLSTPSSVFISANHAYITSQANTRLTALELRHEDSPTLVTGAASISDLQIMDNAQINNDLVVRSGLAVGGNTLLQGNLGVSGSAYFAGPVGVSQKYQTQMLKVNGTITASSDNCAGQSQAICIDTSHTECDWDTSPPPASPACKLFKIDHPTKPGYSLIHSAIEGPEIGVFYRGDGKLANGQAVVELPEYFEALTRQEGRTISLTAIGSQPYQLSYSEIMDGEFRVYGEKEDGEFSWEVQAVRADVEPLEVEKLK